MSDVSHDGIPWTAIADHMWAAYMLSSSALASFFANSFVLLFAYFHPQLKTQYMTRLCRYLFWSDFLWGFCFLFCYSHMRAGRIWQGLSMCLVEALYVSFSLTLVLCHLVLLSHATRVLIIQHKKISSPKLRALSFCAFLFSALMSFLENVWPGTFTLVPTGTYCIADYCRNTLVAILFYLVVLVPLALMMIVNYWKVWSHVRGLPTGLAGGFDASAQHRVAARRMLMYPLMFFGCWTPVAITGFHKWVLGEMPPPLLVGLASSALAHFNGFLNPCVFLAINHHWRTAIKETLAKLCTGSRPSVPSMRSPRLSRRSHTLPHIAATTEGGSSVPRELKEALADDGWRDLFRDFLVEQFCVENLLFFDAVEELRALLQQQQQGETEEAGGKDPAVAVAVAAATAAIVEKYLLPTSEWEVNLPGGTRQEAVAAAAAAAAATTGGGSGAGAGAAAAAAAATTTTTTVFDDCQGVVFRNMAVDSYPRFFIMQQQCAVVVSPLSYADTQSPRRRAWLPVRSREVPVATTVQEGKCAPR